MRKKQRSSSYPHQDGPKKDQQHRSKGQNSAAKSSQQRPLAKTRRPERSESDAHIAAPRDSVIAWGRHAVDAAIKNPARNIIKLYIAPDMVDHVRALSSPVPAADITVMDKAALSDAVSRHLPGDEKAVHQGILAVMRPLNAPNLDDWLDNIDDDRVVVLVLDQITDGRNIGAMMRSARAFGAGAIITTDKHCPPETGAMLRTASGAAEHIPLIRVVNLSRGIEKLQAHGFMVAGMTAAGQTPLKSLADHDRLGIVMGAEGKGLRRLTEEHADMLVRIPIDDDAESLNVSTAAAVALYAARRD